MFSFDTQKHHEPHIHVYYQDQSAIVAIPSGEVLDGEIPSKKLKLVQAWVEFIRMNYWLIGIGCEWGRAIQD